MIGGGVMTSHEIAASQKVATQTISFFGVVPDIRCDTYANDLPSYHDILGKDHTALTAKNWQYENQYPFTTIDYNGDGIIEELELSIFKNRNCIK